MSTLSFRTPRRLAVGVLSGAVAAATLSAVSMAPAQAAPTGTVESGTVQWGLSTYLNSSTMGRPNPKADAYVAPAAFDATTRISSWGGATGTVSADGSADLAFAGSSVNFAATSGAWLRLTDIEADLDGSGNGTVSAEVAYGLAPGTFPGISYDPNQTPDRGPERVDLVDLSGNTAADVARTADGAVTFTGLDGAWAPEFTTFLAGDSTADPAVPGFVYAGQVNGTADRTPLPFTFTVATEAPAVETSIVSSSYDGGVQVKVDGTGFDGTGVPGTVPPDNGVYVGVAEAGGLPPVEDREGMAAFAGVEWVDNDSIVDGAFSRVVVAATDKLDPTKQYSVYTWQAHTHSNTTQDTETEIEIDWASLEEPAAPLTFAGVTAQRYATTNWVGVSVAGVEDGAGTVTLTGVGAAQSAEVEFGRAAFRVPASLVPGAYTARFTLTTEGSDPVVLTKAFNVYKGQTIVGNSLTTTPTRARAGQLLVGAAFTGNGIGQVARPTGQMVVRIYTATGRGVWYSGVKVLSNGTVRLQLPLLPAGTYRANIAYGGGSLALGAAQDRAFTVR